VKTTVTNFPPIEPFCHPHARPVEAGVSQAFEMSSLVAVQRAHRELAQRQASSAVPPHRGDGLEQLRLGRRLTNLIDDVLVHHESLCSVFRIRGPLTGYAGPSSRYSVRLTMHRACRATDVLRPFSFRGIKIDAHA